MKLWLAIILVWAGTCLADFSPLESWVIQNWLSDDTRADVNNDGVCNFADWALACQRDVTKIVIWGRTLDVAKENLEVAALEADFEGLHWLAASYRRCLETM